MGDIEINLYDDLDVIPNKFEKEKQEIVEKYDKLKCEYDVVKEELCKLREKHETANNCESSLKIIKGNFDSMLLTAQTEIDRLKRQNETVRKEMDDIVFRRTRVKNVAGHKTREIGVQTDRIRTYNFGVQTNHVEIRNVCQANKERNEDRKTSGNKDRREDDRQKRLRSRSREKSSKSSSKQSESENERKRSKYDENDNKSDERRRNRRRSSDKAIQSTRMETRKMRRISEEGSAVKTRRSLEKKESDEKVTIESKSRRKTPKKKQKSNIDPIEQSLASLLSEKGVKTTENLTQESNKGNAKDKKRPSSKQREETKEPMEDLRVLLKSKMARKSLDRPSGSDKNCNYDIREPQNMVSKGSEKKSRTDKIHREQKTSVTDERITEKVPVRPLELLWQERQVEALPDESQNTTDLFGSMSDFTLSKNLDDTTKTNRNELLETLYSDSEGVPAQKSSNVDELEEGEIAEEPEQTERKGEIEEFHKTKEKVSSNISVTKVKASSTKKTSNEKKSASKVVPGTVDDSACDLGEIIQKQTNLVQENELKQEEKGSEPPSVIHDEVKTILDSNPELVKSNSEEKLDPKHRLIELSDLEDTTPVQKVSLQKSMESIILQNQELFSEQSNISLLIAADIFLQNENTVKNSAEKCEPNSGNVTNEQHEPNLDKSGGFTGFTTEEIDSSPRNNSNDSQKENICTPVVLKNVQNEHHHHTPKTMTKTEPKQLLTQLNNGPDSSIPTPDTSKDVTQEHLSVNTTEDASHGSDSLNSSAKRKVIETKSTQYVVEETEDMVICTVTRKKRKKEKKDKKHKHKHKHKDRSVEENEIL